MKIKKSPIKNINSYCPIDCPYFTQTTFDHKCSYYKVVLQEGPITHASPRVKDCKWTDDSWVLHWHPKSKEAKKIMKNKGILIKTKFEFSVYDTGRPDIAIITINHIILSSGKEITCKITTFNYYDKYTWSPNTTKFEKQQIIKLLDSDVMLEIISDMKNDFIMSIDGFGRYSDYKQINEKDMNELKETSEWKEFINSIERK